MTGHLRGDARKRAEAALCPCSDPGWSHRESLHRLVAEKSAELTDAGTDVEALVAKWSGCWCGEQQYPDHDPRVRDCPQHGSDDCRHMAEGIVVDLRALAEAGIGSLAQARATDA